MVITALAHEQEKKRCYFAKDRRASQLASDIESVDVAPSTRAPVNSEQLSRELQKGFDGAEDERLERGKEAETGSVQRCT